MKLIVDIAIPLCRPWGDVLVYLSWSGILTVSCKSPYRATQVKANHSIRLLQALWSVEGFAVRKAGETEKLIEVVNPQNWEGAKTGVVTIPLAAINYFSSLLAAVRGCCDALGGCEPDFQIRAQRGIEFPEIEYINNKESK